MPTALSVRPVMLKPPPPKREARRHGWLNRLTHRERMERRWRNRYTAYLLGEPVVEPAQVVLTSDEAAWVLRLDVIAQGDRTSGLRSLSRLAERRELKPVMYAGDGGGVAMYLREDVVDFLQRQSQRQSER